MHIQLSTCAHTHPHTHTHSKKKESHSLNSHTVLYPVFSFTIGIYKGQAVNLWAFKIIYVFLLDLYWKQPKQQLKWISVATFQYIKNEFHFQGQVGAWWRKSAHFMVVRKWNKSSPGSSMLLWCRMSDVLIFICQYVTRECCVDLSTVRIIKLIGLSPLYQLCDLSHV